MSVENNIAGSSTRWCNRRRETCFAPAAARAQQATQKHHHGEAHAAKGAVMRHRGAGVTHAIKSVTAHVAELEERYADLEDSQTGERYSMAEIKNPLHPQPGAGIASVVVEDYTGKLALLSSHMTRKELGLRFFCWPWRHHRRNRHAGNIVAAPRAFPSSHLAESLRIAASSTSSTATDREVRYRQPSTLTSS